MFGTLHHVYMAAAPNIANTAAGKDISSLITSTGTWIAGLGIPAGGLMVAYHAIMRNMSGGDAQTDAHHLSAMKKVLVGTIIVAGAGGIAHFAGGLF
ncbi:hypothetical protein BXT84_00580 [Sulfobacillus thermotolerans]|uniref:Conjugal transfer protein n=1 Tax=Sulfobacillus thermotolerans TaxID=338644 RepID=A0ABN5GY75_9FIRM|nr:hypothetical protein BXT84_00580 [Sulfobacillus thermotolerans]